MSKLQDIAEGGKRKSWWGDHMSKCGNRETDRLISPAATFIQNASGFVAFSNHTIPQCADPVLWQTRLVWIRSSSLFITHCALQRITAKWGQHESVVTYTPPWVSVVYLVRSVQLVCAPVMIWRIKPMCDTYFFFPLWVCGVVGGGCHKWHVTVWPRRSGSGQ